MAESEPFRRRLTIPRSVQKLHMEVRDLLSPQAPTSGDALSATGRHLVRLVL